MGRAAAAALPTLHQTSSAALIVVAGITARVPGGRQPGKGGPADRAADTIQRVPLDRWDTDGADRADWDIGALGSRFGGFVSGWADFDGQAFSVRQPEAAVMDPQQRTLLEVCSPSLVITSKRACNHSTLAA